jgi:hypothetical protein
VKTIVTGGEMPEEQNSGPDKVIAFPDPATKVFNLEMGADAITPAMAYTDILRAAFFAEMRVVDVAALKDKVGGITNFGVRMLYADMLDAAYQKQDLYGKGMAEVSRRALVMMGTDAKVTARWDDPLPVDHKELVEAAAKEAEIGATSKQTLLETLGRDPDVEWERIEEEGARDDAALGDQLQQLGQTGNLRF